MLLSIFTPSHNPSYLLELYNTLKAQTYTNWEWVINLNLPLEKYEEYRSVIEKLNKATIGDSRVTRWNSPLKQEHVGVLKKETCELCSGEYLLEVDHDDLLSPAALETLAEAILREGYPDVIYSNFAEFRDGTLESNVYSSDGWESTTAPGIAPHGGTYVELKSFPAHPATLSRIWYAPNHIRVFKKSFYEQIGGHGNEVVIDGQAHTLDVCDDLDLLCRAYIAGGVFYHLDACLYHYRLLPSSANTYLKKNERIQKLNVVIGDHYLKDMLAEWCRRNNDIPLVFSESKSSYLDHCDNHSLFRTYSYENHEPKVFLGSAPRTLDSMLRKIPDNTASMVIYNKILQYIDSAENINNMRQAHRVLRPNGWLIIVVPVSGYGGSIEDPRIKSQWVEGSFKYFSVPEYMARINYFERFLVHSVKEIYLDNDPQQKYLEVRMIAYKGQYSPRSFGYGSGV